MLTLQEWRHQESSKKIVIGWIKRIGLIDWLFQRKAGCGHRVPASYKLSANGVDLPLTDSQIKAMCPKCAIKSFQVALRKEYNMAVPCFFCGEPIFLGDRIQARFSNGSSSKFPAVIVDENFHAYCHKHLTQSKAETHEGFWLGDKIVDSLPSEEELLLLFNKPPVP